jgi:hypothetical protein
MLGACFLRQPSSDRSLGRDMARLPRLDPTATHAAHRATGLTCYRYIELIPVRAGMVERPSNEERGVD